MSYKDKPQVKLYKYENNAFILDAIIDDFQDISFECNRYRAGQFTITINYNIPNALLFERGLWVQIGDNPYNFGEILNVTDAVGQDGKGSQIRTITGYDARYIFKRRVIKNLNNESNWVMTAKGEICMRSLILDQCGANAESKRQLPVENIIPSVSDAIGKEYSVAESFSNLYEVLCTIATQSEIGWRVKFSGSVLSLEFYQGEDRRDTVRFDTSFESLAQGQFTDSAESFANSVYVGGKGTGSDRDIYEGENGSPEGLDRFEAWDNQSGMTTEDEYEAEALSMLTQYSQTLTVSGQGLAKNPYVYGEQYNVGDIITIAFSGKSAAVQILSVTEHWAWGSYNIEFSFGKPQPDLNNQLQLILKQIQKASDKTSTTDSVKWYTIPTDTAMPSADVVYNTIGFVGTCAGGGSTFTLYLDDEKTGAKTYHVYLKQLGGGSLTLTTGKAGASDLVLNSGTYVAIIYIDENGNVTSQGSTAVNAVQSGNLQPVTSDAVYNAISGFGTVTGVKGNAEGTYRTGNVNLTPANIGAATASDITNAIQALDVSSAGGSGKYISAISETDGKISATAGNISGTVTAGDNAPVSGGAVADILSNLPTDAVLHYSFDEVPDYPDGTADVRLLENNTYDLQSTSYYAGNSGGTTFSNVNGNVQAVISSGQSWYGLVIQYTTSKIIRIKIKVSSLVGSLRVFNGLQTNSIQIGTITSNGEYIYTALFNQDALTKGFAVLVGNASNSATVEILEIYIGDGSYSTPIIDNANGQNNATNNGGIAVQGVSGKGVRFFANKNNPIGANVSSIMGDIAISAWCINYGNGGSYSLIASDQMGNNTNWRLNFNNTAGSIVIAKAGDTYIGPYNISANTLHHFVLIINGTSGKLYCDGNLLGTTAVVNRLIANQLNIGGFVTDANYKLNGMIEDLLIFNRALSETEVKALYYNKANTPKYYSWADWKLSQM